MNKTLIISYYDSGVYWSIFYNDKIVRRDIYDKPIEPYSSILKAYETMKEMDFWEWCSTSFDIKRIIICEDGGILLYERQH